MNYTRVYSIQNDVTAGKVNSEAMVSELKEKVSSANFVELDIEGDVLKVTFDATPTSGDLTLLDSLISNHAPSDAIKTILKNAEQFGKEVIDDYKKLNILRGRSTAEVDTILNDLSGVLEALMSGSLYVAIDRITAFTPTTLVTQADKDDFLNKINKYLGI